ncbi:MAG: 4-phosphoerythronate dehydrogenase [Paludibacteraceae bacterium]|nr:4-phosphoerythronate dehydrogenase [Paludibacteraceae bacterium]
MQVVIDKGIPFLDGVFPSDIEALHLAPEEITPAAIRNADALFVRTRTQINKELLQGSKVRFVATATIGFDHIDQAYCREAGIHWVSCPGCNAQAVCDYVENVLITLDSKQYSKTIGVIGYGHVGKLVAAMAERVGYKVMISDPPLGIGRPLEEMASQCDIITLHTPLTYIGDYSTYHLFNQTVLAQCKPNILLINAARGGVVDEQALLKHLMTDQGKDMQVAIDCWEGEPYINKTLLQQSDLASFHIAGYSIEGKMRASEMCLHAFCEFFSLPILSINKKVVPLHGDSAPGWLCRISDQLKAQPENFEQLRKKYPLR